MLWVAAGVVVAVLLVRSGRISTTDVILFCVMVPSIILHEIAHGVVALGFGDDTAKRAGRLTLNPLAHVDPLGTILVPAIMAISGLGLFGWAKPVPVNLGRLRSPRNHGVLVSLAGPFTNAVLALVAAALFLGLHEQTAGPGPGLTLFAQVLFLAGLVNVALTVFNLLPVPPLDGSVLLERILPKALWPGYLRIRPYTLPILVGLVVLDSALHLNLLGGLYTDLFTWWAHVLHLGVL